MADLSVTAASVLASSSAVTRDGIAGETITAGQAVYKDATTNKWKKAQADAADTSRDAMPNVGIALNGAGNGQPLKIVTHDIDFTPGATLTSGAIYALSDGAAGGICPLADIEAGDSLIILGIASSTTKMRLTPVYGSANYAVPA